MHTRSKAAAEGLRTVLAEHEVELIEYVPGHAGSVARVAIRCRTCGAPDRLSAGTITEEWSGCRPCRRNKGLTRRPHRCYTTAAVAAFIAGEGGKYLGGEVSRHDSMVTYRCRYCGDVGEKSAKHMYRHGPSGRCCAGRRGSVTSAITGGWLEQAHNAARERGGKCLATRPITTIEHIWWECAQRHKWPASYASVVTAGRWCKRCAGSKGERYVIALLEGAFGQDFPSARPDWLGGLELDGYCAELGLAVEVHGIQHYRRSQYYHESEAAFRAQQRRDAIKQQLCDRQGVALMVIPYINQQDWAAVRDRVRTRLKGLGFLPTTEVDDVIVDSAKVYDFSDEKYQEFLACVKRRGGRFLARDYAGFYTRLPVTCDEGHQFTPHPYTVVNQGTWCRKCAGSAPLTTEEITQLLAELRWSLDDGEEYVSAQSVLRLRCPNGHLVFRSWNCWQQSRVKRSIVTCQQCDIDEKITLFRNMMRDRGLMVIDDLHKYTRELAVRVRCGYCGEIRTRQTRSCEKAKSTPCCGHQFVAPS